MKQIVRAAAILTIAASGASAQQGQDELTVQELLAMCSIDIDAPDVDWLGGGVCLGMTIQANAMGSLICSMVAEGFENKLASIASDAGGVTIEEMRLAFVSWARAHPEMSNQVGPWGMAFALAEAFPCVP